MKRAQNVALFSALTAMLASCSMVGPGVNEYTMARQTVVKSTDPVYAPAGTARIVRDLGTTRTNITLTGMTPYAIYVAHYHKQGQADVPACESGGAAIMESKIVAQADKDGKVTMQGLVANALIDGATYLNVHHARDFGGTPSDSGVICSPVTLN